MGVGLNDIIFHGWKRNKDGNNIRGNLMHLISDKKKAIKNLIKKCSQNKKLLK